MLELQQVERELSVVEVDERLERLSELNAEIEIAAKRRDQMKRHYQMKMFRADELFEKETENLRAEIDSLTLELRRYATANITGKKRTLELPGGKLSFRKRQPIFYIGGAPVTNDNPQIVRFAKNLDGDLVKIRETADWATLKTKLAIDDDGKVYVKDTGEVVPDMRAKQFPDDFKVETA